MVIRAKKVEENGYGAWEVYFCLGLAWGFSGPRMPYSYMRLLAVDNDGMLPEKDKYKIGTEISIVVKTSNISITEDQGVNGQSMVSRSYN